MSAHLTDEEQVERLKQWIKEFGPTVITVIAIVLIASFSWRYWQGHQESIRDQASTSYEQLILNELSHNDKQVQLQARYLIKEYPKTSYAEFASLQLARIDVESNNYPDAINQLHWVIQSTKTVSLKAIAQIRLSRILLAQNNLPQALKVLNEVNAKAFVPAVLSVKGDIYLAMSDRTAARNAYQQALARMPSSDGSSRTLLEMKLAEVAEVPGALNHRLTNA